MGHDRIYVFPVLLFLLMPVTFFITYTISVINEHVDPGFPYISDTGSLPPESCVFGQILNIAAFIMACCVYVKYLQVRSYSNLVPNAIEVSPLLNKVGLCLGLMTCLGVDIVANFQESNVIVVHMIGAFLCFGAGTVYFMLQSWISYKMPEFTSRRILLIRVILVGVCVLSTVSTILTGISSFLRYEGPPGETKKWKPEYGGYELHLASTASEWILCISFSAVILTFVPEFYGLEVEDPVIKCRQKDPHKRSMLF